MAGIRALRSLPGYSIFHDPAVTGIGNPKRFPAQLNALGCSQSSGAFPGAARSYDLEQSAVRANNPNAVVVLASDDQGAVRHYLLIARAAKVIGRSASALRIFRSGVSKYIRLLPVSESQVSPDGVSPTSWGKDRPFISCRTLPFS